MTKGATIELVVAIGMSVVAALMWVYGAGIWWKVAWTAGAALSWVSYLFEAGVFGSMALVDKTSM